MGGSSIGAKDLAPLRSVNLVLDPKSARTRLGTRQRLEYRNAKITNFTSQQLFPWHANGETFEAKLKPTVIRQLNFTWVSLAR